MTTLLPQEAPPATIRAMKQLLLALAVFSSCVFAQQERPNMPVYRSGPWFVVRSVRDGGNVVACTGFYRANRRVQLSKDMLIIQNAAVEVQSVAFGFDDEPMAAQRPLTDGEKDLKGIAFTGDDFAKLSKAHKVRIDVVTTQGTMRHELDLSGLAGALDNIAKGCPVPADKPAEKTRRRRHRN